MNKRERLKLMMRNNVGCPTSGIIKCICMAKGKTYDEAVEGSHREGDGRWLRETTSRSGGQRIGEAGVILDVEPAVLMGVRGGFPHSEELRKLFESIILGPEGGADDG